MDSGGAYTLAITNHSSDLDVPTYSLPWSTTTLAHDVATGTIAASDTTQRTLTADAGGYLSADLSWTKGQHEVSSTSPASFLGGQTINTVIRPDAPGDVSATVDWDPKTVWDSDQSSVGTLGTTNYALTASGAGTIQAELSWPSGLPNPDLDLYLIDSTNATVASSANLTGNAESLSYQVPSSVGYTTPANYTLRVQAKAAGSSYTLTWGVPKTAHLDLELWSGSTKLASNYSATQKPKSITAANQPAGDYTLKVISRDYGTNAMITQYYQRLDWADLTLELRDSAGQVLKSARSASGDISFTLTLPSAADYTLKITNHSTDLNVPSYTLETVLPQALPALARIELENQAGTVLASSDGASPRSLSAAVGAGVYQLVVTPTQGTASASLAGSYPGRLAKMEIGYDGNDHAISIDDGTTKTLETLAPSGRVLRRTIRDSITNDVLEDVLVGYDSDGDSPAYERPYPTGDVMTYVVGPDGLLVIDTAGAAEYPLTNANGDIIGTTDASGVATATPASDEFGVADEVPDSRLGWLGGKTRFATGGGLGLIRMGVRLYDPKLGRFLQVDPIEGGSANDYDYVAQDPCNHYDLDGRRMEHAGGAGGRGGACGGSWREVSAYLGVFGKAKNRRKNAWSHGAKGGVSVVGRLILLSKKARGLPLRGVRAAGWVGLGITTAATAFNIYCRPPSDRVRRASVAVLRAKSGVTLVPFFWL